MGGQESIMKRHSCENTYLMKPEENVPRVVDKEEIVQIILEIDLVVNLE